MKVIIKSIDEAHEDLQKAKITYSVITNPHLFLLNKAFEQKEILHFATPKWTKRGVFAGEEKRREAKKLKEEGRKELESWAGKDVIKRLKAGQQQRLGEHVSYHRTVKGRTQMVRGKGMPKIRKESKHSKVKVFTPKQYSQKQLVKLIPERLNRPQLR